MNCVFEIFLSLCSFTVVFLLYLNVNIGLNRHVLVSQCYHKCPQNYLCALEHNHRETIRKCFISLNHCFICTSATPSLFSLLSLSFCQTRWAAEQLWILFLQRATNKSWNEGWIIKSSSTSKFKYSKLALVITLHVYMVRELSEIFFSPHLCSPTLSNPPSLACSFFLSMIKGPLVQGNNFKLTFMFWKGWTGPVETTQQASWESRKKGKQAMKLLLFSSEGFLAWSQTNKNDRSLLYKE